MISTEDVDGSTASPPDGWDFYDGDPSVGVSGGWAHVECPLWPDGTDLHALFPILTVDALGQVDVEVPRVVHASRITCECGMSIVVAS